MGFDKLDLCTPTSPEKLGTPWDTDGTVLGGPAPDLSSPFLNDHGRMDVGWRRAWFLVRGMRILGGHVILVNLQG